MARLAAGDRAAIFTLATVHGGRIAGVVRQHLRACGVSTVSRDDLDGLVLDACLEIAEVAGAWRPGGALPWRWAEHRIRLLVARWVGVHADPIDLHDGSVLHVVEPPAPAPTTEAPLAETFAKLVRDVPDVALFRQAALAGGVDDAQLLLVLDYRIQQNQGDRAPAETLAPRYGVSTQTLRKRVSRASQRIRSTVEAEPRFAPLAEYVLVA